MGVRLDGALVIIDEAHNITEAVESVHSASVDEQQLCALWEKAQTLAPVDL